MPRELQNAIENLPLEGTKLLSRKTDVCGVHVKIPVRLFALSVSVSQWWRGNISDHRDNMNFKIILARDLSLLEVVHQLCPQQAFLTRPLLQNSHFGIRVEDSILTVNHLQSFDCPFGNCLPFFYSKWIKISSWPIHFLLHPTFAIPFWGPIS